MAMTWTDHMAGVNGLLDAERARRAAARTAAQQARATAAPPPTVAPEMPQGFQETWQGGMNTGDIGAATAPGNLGNMIGGFGLNGQSIGGLLGALGGGLVGGPFGGLLGGLAGRGIGGLLGQGGGLGGENDPANAGSATGGSANSAAAGYGGGYGTGFEGWGGLKDGGYTGAGHDGVVQPDRVARKLVHEGELVIPHHMVKRMIRGLLG